MIGVGILLTGLRDRENPGGWCSEGSSPVHGVCEVTRGIGRGKREPWLKRSLGICHEIAGRNLLAHVDELTYEVAKLGYWDWHPPADSLTWSEGV